MLCSTDDSRGAPALSNFLTGVVIFDERPDLAERYDLGLYLALISSVFRAISGLSISASDIYGMYIN